MTAPKAGGFWWFYWHMWALVDQLKNQEICCWNICCADVEPLMSFHHCLTSKTNLRWSMNITSSSEGVNIQWWHHWHQLIKICIWAQLRSVLSIHSLKMCQRLQSKTHLLQMLKLSITESWSAAAGAQALPPSLPSFPSRWFLPRLPGKQSVRWANTSLRQRQTAAGKQEMTRRTAVFTKVHRNQLLLYRGKAWQRLA